MKILRESILVKDTGALAGDMGGQLSILGVGSSHEGSQEDVLVEASVRVENKGVRCWISSSN